MSPRVAFCVDFGGTTTRVGVVDQTLALIETPTQIPSLGAAGQNQQQRAKLFDQICELITHHHHCLEQHHQVIELIGISFGAVIDNSGRVVNASVLWSETAKGFDVADQFRQRIPSLTPVVVNDVTAMAWRHHHLQRFLMVTVSTGIGNKLFDSRLNTDLNIVQDAGGLGGEMGHVVVAPDRLNQALEQLPQLLKTAGQRPNQADPGLTAASIGPAAAAGDPLARELLDRLQLPWCPCGNLADLGAFASGPGTVRISQFRARAYPEAFQNSLLGQLCGDQSSAIEPGLLGLALQQHDSFTEKCVSIGVSYLAQRILQCCADTGVDQVVIGGGFANGMGTPYFDLLRQQVVSLGHPSGFFSGWSQQRFSNLVQPASDYQNDALIGAAALAFQHAQRSRLMIKQANRSAVRLTIEQNREPGAGQLLCSVRYAGICSTDLQILRSERAYEPGVPGHECVAQILQLGDAVKQRPDDLRVGQWITLNPNNPLDPYDKIGHNQSGVFRDQLILCQELLIRGQIVALPDHPEPGWVMLELLACVLNGQQTLDDAQLEQASPSDQTLLIIGAGVSGMIHAMAARALGKNFILASRSQKKLDWAIHRGILHPEETLLLDKQGQALLADPLAYQFDAAVITLAGTFGSQRLQQYLPWLNHQAAILLFGGFNATTTIDLGADEPLEVKAVREQGRHQVLQFTPYRSLQFVGSRGCLPQHTTLARDLLASARIDLNRLVTHIISMTSAPAVMETLLTDATLLGTKVGRVVIDTRISGESITRFEPVTDGPTPTLSINHQPQTPQSVQLAP